MAREIGRLKALEVARKRKPGLYPDGGGLYLQVTPAGAKSWVYRYTLNGRTRYMGLGATHAVGLADARKKATAARQARQDGTDPIEVRKAEVARVRLEAARALTFQDAAEKYIKSHRSAWRNAKHAAQWESTLKTYAYPVLGKLSVQEIDVGLVMRVLEPIWVTKSETAGRVRGRIEAVLDWATAHSYRRGENPARWRGHLNKLLPARSKARAVKNHPRLPYEEIGPFIEALRKQEGVAARALEFLILTAARTGEVIGAQWGEFGTDGVWVIPASRMKSGKEHRVPLPAPAQAIIEDMREVRTSGNGRAYVFPGGRRGKPLSNGAFLALLRRMKRSDITPHGFRSTFRDWCAERTSYPSEVAEMALAHAVSDKVERAYRRGDLLEKRRRIMRDWSQFCGTKAKGGEVVAIGGRKQ